jgi:CDGSH-type Zn-finger protein/truncated hemoglobin YjbI
VPGRSEELRTAWSSEARSALELASAVLYASFSLKAHPDEGGLTEDHARLVRAWKRQLVAAGATQLATFAQAASSESPLAGTSGAGDTMSVVVEPFSDSVLARLARVAEADPASVVDAAARRTSGEAPVVESLAPWLPDADGSPPRGLDETRTEWRATVAEAERDGVRFDPVRPVVESPTVEEGSSERSVLADELTRAVAELFNSAWDTALATLIGSVSADGSDHTVRTARRLLNSVVRPLGEALARRPAGPGHPADARAGATFTDVTPDLEPMTPDALDDRLWRMALDATRLATRPGIPAEVLEATAALQDLATPADKDLRAARIVELRAAQAAVPAGLQTVTNGPYVATNVDDIQTALGEPIPTLPLVALCRCGQSNRKPFCDGTHAQIEFTDVKDPNRVPDRHDSFPGLQATILDNRGTCAHSGFCTDRLPTVFRQGAEPFVTPSGGRLDEVIQAVRACPSGALSYAIEGHEAREQVDQDRPPQIEVSQDGPYRITGGIALTDATGNDMARNAGASREHYSLCRCGHSQNKPFCSGMHWYVDFHDPPPPESPTLFQWAGGLPALLRMTRIFYRKYVPEDPLLSELFASMSPDHPERVAAWLGEVFGGPKYYSDQYGGYRRMVSQHIGKQITEQHRSRWVAALCRAADDAKLPADPEFRAAFVAYLEWGSRIAVENSTVGARPPESMPVPRWWWVADATPDARVPALAPREEQEDEAPVELPADGEPVSYEQHIKPLFRTRDRQSMRFAFDLWSHDDVTHHGAAILARIRNGTMPCDGAWPDEKIQVLQRWIDSGMPE